MRRHHAAPAVVAVVLLGACSDEPDLDSPAEGVQSAMTAACERLKACGEPLTCFTLDTTLRTAIERSNEAGRTVYDRLLMEACVMEIQQLPCAQAEYDLAGLAFGPSGFARLEGTCRGAYRGLVPQGGACTMVSGFDTGDCAPLDTARTYCSDTLTCTKNE